MSIAIYPLPNKEKWLYGRLKRFWEVLGGDVGTCFAPRDR